MMANVTLPETTDQSSYIPTAQKSGLIKSYEQNSVQISASVAVYALLLYATNPVAKAKQDCIAKLSPDAEPKVIASVGKSLEQFKGKVVLLDLWATWCPPCRIGIPGFVKLQDKYCDKGLVIVGISLDPVDPRGAGGAEAVGPFMKKAKINYPVWMVEDRQALEKYLVDAYPTTYLIGRDGKIKNRYVGAQPDEVIEAAIAAALDET